LIKFLIIDPVDKLKWIILLLSTTMKFAWRFLFISPTPPSKKPTQVSWNAADHWGLIIFAFSFFEFLILQVFTVLTYLPHHQ
jgi:hypothetical protein